ncbi:grpe protein homolog [Plakobranchus ocellatus]|uniref:Grpe protein homolog n=1 Tax=Plakobranchus ocellatus TaxID=259542 RepID=A0AAV3XYY7_9GAST|nr:grpe protein homolog [Plakobranchus ocellatus]
MATNSIVVRAFSLSSKLMRTLTQNNNVMSNSRCLCRQITTATDNGPKPDASPPDPVEAKAIDEVLTKQKEELTSQIGKLKEELKESKDKYMRSIAETENLRKRMTKQVDDAKLFGIQGFCKDLLEVSDILGTAVSSVPKEELKDSNPHLVNLYQGLNMTESQLIKVFKKHGLESINPSEGEKFDPHFHEALFQVPIQSAETQEADTIAIVQKNGFKLHNRTLRPALVGVFKAS